jgi:hypothetical protein
MAEVKSMKRNIKPAKSLVESRFFAGFCVEFRASLTSWISPKKKPFLDVGKNSERTKAEPASPCH